MATQRAFAMRTENRLFNIGLYPEINRSGTRDDPFDFSKDPILGASPTSPTGGRGGLTWQANWEFVESLWSICSHFAQWVSCEFVQNKPAKSPTRYFLNEPPGFFDNFVQNLPTICLSHSLRVLSKNAQKFDHNVLNHILNEFFEKNPPGILWSNIWAFCERTLNEWLRKIVGEFWTKLSKNPGGSFRKYLVGDLVGLFWTNSQLTHWSNWDQSGE